jgi:hypothetical protein
MKIVIFYYLMTKPVESNEFATAELSGDFEEHRTDERHSAVDWRTAESVPVIIEG